MANDEHFDGYLLGILHAIEFVQRGHGQDVIATEFVTEVLAGGYVRELKAIAKREGLRIKWTDIDREVRRQHARTA